MELKSQVQTPPSTGKIFTREPLQHPWLGEVPSSGFLRLPLNSHLILSSKEAFMNWLEACAFLLGRAVHSSAIPGSEWK